MVLGEDCGVGAPLAVLHLSLIGAIVIVLIPFSVEVRVFEVDQSLGQSFCLETGRLLLAVRWALLVDVE